VISVFPPRPAVPRVILNDLCERIGHLVDKELRSGHFHCLGREHGRRFSNSVTNAIKTETFVCDTCGLRNRLNTARRHNCEECDRGSPGEMRYFAKLLHSFSRPRLVVFGSICWSQI
jgi:hypothetical protein